MTNKKKCPDCPKCLPGWLLQFGDMMSLLLVFFVLLVSMSTFDKKKVEEYFNVMRRTMGFLEGAEDTSSAQKTTASKTHASDSKSGGDSVALESQEDTAQQEIQDLTQDFNEVNDEEYENIEVLQGNNEFSIFIPSSLMFDRGEYNINNGELKQFIARLSRVIRTMPEKFQIEVMGYSAQNRRHSSIPRDSWDLSALRAISVLKELVRNKIDPSWLKASAFGSYHRNSQGSKLNRKVELKFITIKENNQMIEEANFFDRITK